MFFKFNTLVAVNTEFNGFTKRGLYEFYRQIYGIFQAVTTEQSRKDNRGKQVACTRITSARLFSADTKHLIIGCNKIVNLCNLIGNFMLNACNNHGFHLVEFQKLFGKLCNRIEKIGRIGIFNQF